MGAAAVNIGRNDLAGGIGIVTQLAVEEKVPWVSANVRPAGGKPAYPSSRLIQWGEKKIGVFGLAPPSPRTDPELGVVVEDPVESARRAAAELSEADLIVCLSGLGLTADKALAGAVPRIAVIVGSGEGQRLLDPPLRAGDTLILRCADRGRQVGVLDLDAAAVGPNWKTPVPEGAADAVRGQIGQFTARLGSPPGGRAPDPSERARVERSIAALRGSLEELEKSPVHVHHRIVPLSNEVPDDPAVKKEVDGVLSHRPAARPRTAPVAGRSPSSSPPRRKSVWIFPPAGAGWSRRRPNRRKANPCTWGPFRAAAATARSTRVGSPPAMPVPCPRCRPTGVSTPSAAPATPCSSTSAAACGRSPWWAAKPATGRGPTTRDRATSSGPFRRRRAAPATGATTRKRSSTIDATMSGFAAM